MSKSLIIAESGEGTIHNLRKIAAGEPCAMEGNLGRAPPVSYHIEIRTLYAEACLGNKRLLGTAKSAIFGTAFANFCGDREGRVAPVYAKWSLTLLFSPPS